jgi:hypothetical protein
LCIEQDDGSKILFGFPTTKIYQIKVWNFEVIKSN